MCSANQVKFSYYKRINTKKFATSKSGRLKKRLFWTALDELCVELSLISFIKSMQRYAIIFL